MVGGRSRKKLMVCTYFKRFISTPWFIEAECLGKKKVIYASPAVSAPDEWKEK